MGKQSQLNLKALGGVFVGLVVLAVVGLMIPAISSWAVTITTTMTTTRPGTTTTTKAGTTTTTTKSTTTTTTIPTTTTTTTAAPPPTSTVAPCCEFKPPLTWQFARPWFEDPDPECPIKPPPKPGVIGGPIKGKYKIQVFHHTVDMPSEEDSSPGSQCTACGVAEIKVTTAVNQDVHGCPLDASGSPILRDDGDCKYEAQEGPQETLFTEVYSVCPPDVWWNFANGWVPEPTERETIDPDGEPDTGDEYVAAQSTRSFVIHVKDCAHCGGNESDLPFVVQLIKPDGKDFMTMGYEPLGPGEGEIMYPHTPCEYPCQREF